MHDEKWRSEECGNQPNPVADAVRDFFPLRLISLGDCKQFAHDCSF
jgi:hypothetical protein